MTIAYLDCISGISGDMTLGALIDAGLDKEALVNELQKLGLRGWQFTTSKVKKHNIAATKVTITHDKQKQHRHYTDIIKLIDESGLKQTVKERAKAIFTTLGKAEAKIHDTPLEKVHFHEVGAVDSIIDIVGTAIALDMLGIEKLYVSSLPLSHGTVQCEHGEMPIPAPATLQCLTGFHLYDKNVQGELITPTGAAIVGTLATQQFPAMNVQRTGIGAGTKDFTHPNILRVIVGKENNHISDTVDTIETNIDDMSPELVAHVREELLNHGALDVYTIPVHTKKNRTGLILGVISPPEHTQSLVNILFKETTTIGLRIQQTSRITLHREIKNVETPHGTVRVKYTYHNNTLANAKPEFDDCQKIAKEKGIPLKHIMKDIEQHIHHEQN